MEAARVDAIAIATSRWLMKHGLAYNVVANAAFKEILEAAAGRPIDVLLETCITPILMLVLLNIARIPQKL
ncbi:hypothetical protein AC1031_006342 [Aphanomyces cochlioides]|nr:hypothetical protein AC1031_006339 [Aphanomyces cochlioides]KAG9402793.1 hypothetical protein AC1031_006342 [Aphanomyces cochlioides]